jgi:ABC-type transport system substrate-binding protein
MMRAAKQPTIFYGPSSNPDDGGELISGWYAKDSVWSSGNIDVPEYSQIFREQLQAVDLEKRKQTLQRFAKLESENFESIPLFWCHTTFAVGTRIKKWEPAVGSAYQFNMQSIELVK